TLGCNPPLAETPIPAGAALPRAGRGLLPFLAATAPLWWAWLRAKDLPPASYERRLVAALLVVSVPSAFLGLRFFPHYFIQLYVPLALGAAPWVGPAFTAPLAPSARLRRAAPPPGRGPPPPSPPGTPPRRSRPPGAGGRRPGGARIGAPPPRRCWGGGPRRPSPPPPAGGRPAVSSCPRPPSPGTS